jgi:hypothetical protein
MRTSPSAKNKIGFINGTIMMVLSWILNSIHPHPDLASGVIYAETTTKVWNDLKERFSKGSESKTFLSFKI